LSHSQAVSPSLAHTTDLSLDATGSFVLYATDEYFAAKENLLKPGAPEWRESAYTDRGKWMDGWESQRRRTPGHDFVIVRLGTPGSIEAVLCDTTHFKGNAPQSVSVEVLDLPAATAVEELLALPVVSAGADTGANDERAWHEVIARAEVLPDTQNVLVPAVPTARASHLRLRIHPDGGVARLRVLGRVLPDPHRFWGAGSVDLSAIENGGTIAAASDAFFGPPVNLLLPGRGAHMGEGWETKRRRTPGSDWCVIALGRRGVVERIELDTHFFKGNAPLAARIEGLDVVGLGAGERGDMFAAQAGWEPLVGLAPLVPHHRHALESTLARPVTHVRVHMIPHGGIHRLRAFGRAIDTAGELEALGALHALSAEQRLELFRSLCGAQAFAERMASAMPFASVRAWFAAADLAFTALDEAAWLEAFAAHPTLGEAKPAPAATTRSAGWSQGEQSALAAGAEDARERLRAGNQEYRGKFGFVFLACANGRSAGELADWLEERIGNERAAEVAIAAGEQVRITRLRMGRWLQANGA
jgi:allantoicase